jgi:hypothetical protein
LLKINDIPGHLGEQNLLEGLAREWDAGHKTLPGWVAYNPDHVRDVLARMIVQPDCLVLVAFNADRLFGAVGAYLSHHVMNRDAALALELFCWVSPNARGVDIGSGLMVGLQAWAHEKKAARLIIPSMNVDQGTVDRFDGHGFMAAEMVWVKDTTDQPVTMPSHRPHNRPTTPTSVSLH